MAQVMIREVHIGDQALQYSFEQKQVKNLNLRVRKDCSVYVSANPSVPLQQVDEFVISKMEFIRSAQEKFRKMEEYAPAPKQFISGESFYILGRELRLRVEKASKEEIYSDGVYLFLHVKDTDNFARKQRLATKFLDYQCMRTFEEIMDKIYPIFQKYGVPFPKLRIRNMETRWGSCLPRKGIITLNKRLLEVPMNCIEYVIMHEFCHFLHPDHSKKFYAFLSMLMPDWKDRKAVLEKSAFYGL